MAYLQFYTYDKRQRYANKNAKLLINILVAGIIKPVTLTRALERGGRFCPPLMFFVNIFRSIRSIAVIFSIPAQK